MRLAICMAAAIAALAADRPPSAAEVEDASLRQLLTIRRVYIDRLTGGETAAQMREILFSSLQGTRLFIVTEKEERADAVLRGGAEDLVYTEQHSSSDGVNAHSNFGTGRPSTSSRGAYAGISVGENESEHSTDRRHEAIAAVRLVNKDGDVIWATTQESLGAKFRGASADVAEKITAKLKEDFERARNLKP
ncbi:MAG TPA: hypothetical protein VMS37_24220 [Verrucomicrobiae bacterium]|nr:hypothetical protein [Verrucomicrobiae bacterium]